MYLNTPTVAPGARPVIDALHEAEARWEAGEFSWQAWEQEAETTRGAFGRLIGADESAVALLPSVSEAASTVAASLPPGRVVVGAFEFRSNLFPWMALERRGFHLELVSDREGVVATGDLVSAIDGQTVLVAVTEVQSSNGFRVRLPEIAARCHEVGARLFVNLTQMAGALCFDVSESQPDFVAAHGYKWLLAPRGTTWLYVRPDRLGEIDPLTPNWKSVPDPYAGYYGPPFELAADTRRLDASLAWFPWVGARAAMDIVGALDMIQVQSRCLSLADEFRAQAASRGFRLVPQEAPSHIVGVIVPDADSLKQRLASRRVVAAVRGGFLRLGFHAFNDESDVEAALAALGRSS